MSSVPAGLQAGLNHQSPQVQLNKVIKKMKTTKDNDAVFYEMKHKHGNPIVSHMLYYNGISEENSSTSKTPKT